MERGLRVRRKEKNQRRSHLKSPGMWEKAHKKESRDMTSWWRLRNGSPASHNWNNGARCQKSKRHTMHTGATNVRGSIDRKMADWWQRWSISLGSCDRSLYGWLLLHCNTQWWKTVGPPAAHLQGCPFPELLIRRQKAQALLQIRCCFKINISLIKPLVSRRKKKNLQNL